MHRSKSTFVLTLTFVLGCAAATVVAPLRVPPIRAGATPQKWEQVCVPYADDAVDTKIVPEFEVREANKPNGWNKVLAAYGEQGWELVTVGFINAHIMSACFKRPR